MTQTDHSLIVHGTPYRALDDDTIGIIEDISTDEMMLRSANARITLIRERVGERMGTLSGRMCLSLLNALSGFVLPVLCLYVYYVSGGAPCDKPVAGWLYTYGVLGVLLGVLGVWLQVRNASVAPIVAHAQGLEGDARAAAMAPAMAVVASNGCIACCCMLPVSTFVCFWWIKGNFDVWGTYPREDISATESIATFAGCDATLLNSARGIYLVSYAIILFFCVTGCALLGLIAGEVLREADRASAAGGGVNRMV